MSEAPANGPAEGQQQGQQEGQQPAEGQQTEATTPPPEDDLAKAKRQARHWESEAKKRDKALADATTRLSALEEQHKSAEDKALDQARKEGTDKANTEWSAKYRTLAVRSAAVSMLSGVVTAPDLALPHLDLSAIDVADDGTVDADALKAQVEAVLEKYPVLAVDADGNQPPHPHADLGPRKTPPAQKSVSDQLREALRPRR
ncbi:hypothetical protein GCM10029976_090900 [Kribbella albertanoniae]|uniref:Scaffolding protein n=1 Tax=Kribbella albertanoniae TaxID=1266829 RepID=A0A4R4PJC5_9ACTN|nr:hypothetical protein [Kribbella albertanoniae]TDC22160.1 hypothetical protein E1261_31720 [Kribbella albertanoniae]